MRRQGNARRDAGVSGTVGARAAGPVRDLPQNLIWIKESCERLCASFAMPPTPPTDPAREAADLMNLAAWYRDWAAAASTEHEKAQRIDFAIGLEKRARAMLKPD
jgi:hypothetical protein